MGQRGRGNIGKFDGGCPEVRTKFRERDLIHSAGRAGRGRRVGGRAAGATPHGGWDRRRPRSPGDRGSGIRRDKAGGELGVPRCSTMLPDAPGCSRHRKVPRGTLGAADVPRGTSQLRRRENSARYRGGGVAAVLRWPCGGPAVRDAAGFLGGAVGRCRAAFGRWSNGREPSVLQRSNAGRGCARRRAGVGWRAWTRRR